MKEKYQIDTKKFIEKFCFTIVFAFLVGVSVGMIIGHNLKPSSEKEPILESTQATAEPTKTSVLIEWEIPKATQEPTLMSEPTKEEAEPALTSLGMFETTAYCSCMKCCGKTDGITATGTQATEGRTIAVDPNVIPYGTKVIINGNEYIAEDCGGAIKNNRIDVYFDSHEKALEYGRQTVEVFTEGGEENV